MRRFRSNIAAAMVQRIPVAAIHGMARVRDRVVGQCATYSRPICGLGLASRCQRGISGEGAFAPNIAAQASDPASPDRSFMVQGRMPQ
jgi:hypothetical protein